MPRPLEFAFVLGMALQFFSESTKLFELIYYWDKLVHPTLIALTAMIAAWLLLGYRDAFGKRLPIHLVGAFSMLLGISIGAFWEFIEFTSDWFGNADLQKSNGDTITDIISNNIGSFLATLLALYLYTHFFSSRQRESTGLLARWLAHGPLLLVRRHGRLLGGVVTAAFLGLVFMSQWIDRGTPALASDLQPGQSATWQFADSAPLTNALVLSGDWVPDPRGICHENLENPKPGSEKMGVLQLAPGSVYSGDFSVQARYFEERPAMSQGSEMDAGIAFGIRDATDFDLIEENALHDVLRLDQFIHGNRRDLREKLYRTHGNEWHTLQLSVSGATITAGIDGETIYTVENVPAADGGIGLWARGAAATCFSDASVTVGASS
ncbi:MAG: hypothetical protein JOZ87_02755 [Chloroflexi bacterium]|nr:hypothetical protein [Chloroflexota bacterium]